jgi:hypothetical protein
MIAALAAGECFFHLSGDAPYPVEKFVDAKDIPEIRTPSTDRQAYFIAEHLSLKLCF